MTVNIILFRKINIFFSIKIEYVKADSTNLPKVSVHIVGLLLESAEHRV